MVLKISTEASSFVIGPQATAETRVVHERLLASPSTGGSQVQVNIFFFTITYNIL
jgi:hypothetical protein